MITILGLGFVGLTTGLGFSKKGFKTYCFDIDEERVEMIKNFVIPFHEPHLEEVLKETYGKTFFLNADFSTAIKESEAVFICVGTPSAEDGSADLSYLLSAINQIIEVEDNKFKVIVTKSTVPPSTVSEKIIPYVREKVKLHDRNIGFASNPEFLREGFCWEDFIDPDRIVIGVEDEDSKKILNKIYLPFNSPIHYVSYNSAEYIKYLSNSLLSTLVSFANEMAMIADLIGDIDIGKAFKVLHEDKRWSGSPAKMSSYVYPGCGYGGYCLPKDTSALNSLAIQRGHETHILKGNLKVNEQIKNYVVNKIKSNIKKDEVIGVLGLSFKPESDDVRLTPSRDIIHKLIETGYTKIMVYDPLSNDSFKAAYPDLNVEYCESLDFVLTGTDNIILLTAWKEFKDRKSDILLKRVFDFRYIF